MVTTLPAARADAGSPLAVHAALALARLESADVLSTCTQSCRTLVDELHGGRPLSRVQVDAAREEISRLRALLSDLRDLPRLDLYPGRVRLAPAVRVATADLENPSKPAKAWLVVDVPGEIVVAVSATALAFVLHGAVGALLASGFARLRAAARPPPEGTASVTLRLESEKKAGQNAPVFPARSWIGKDKDAITFAVARRVARASNMRLRPMQDGLCVATLEIPRG